jgi:hypothetical protein
MAIRDGTAMSDPLFKLAVNIQATSIAMQNLFNQTIPEWWSGFITDIGTLADAAWDGITAGLKGIADALTTIANLQSTAFDKLKGLLDSFGGKDFNPFTPASFNTQGQEMSEFGPVTKVPALDTTAIEASIDELIEKIQLAFILIKNQIAFDVQVISQIISIGFGQAVTNVPIVMDELIEKVMLSFTLLKTQIATDMIIIKTSIELAFATLSTTVPEILDELIEKVQLTFSLIVTTSASTVNSIESNFAAMHQAIIQMFTNLLSKATAVFNKLASNFQSTMNKMVSSAKSAVSKINSELNKLNRTVTTTHVIKTKKVNAAKGFQGVVSNPTTFNVAEGGKPEFVSVTPLKDFRDSNAGGITSTVRMPKNRGGQLMSNSQPTIIVYNYLDGQQIKGKIVQMLASNQSAMK